MKRYLFVVPRIRFPTKWQTQSSQLVKYVSNRLDFDVDEDELPSLVHHEIGKEGDVILNLVSLKCNNNPDYDDMMHMMPASLARDTPFKEQDVEVQEATIDADKSWYGFLVFPAS